MGRYLSQSQTHLCSNALERSFGFFHLLKILRSIITIIKTCMVFQTPSKPTNHKQNNYKLTVDATITHFQNQT